MAKINLNDIQSIYDLTFLNQNAADIESEFQNKVLYRDNPVGEPNQMENDLDMNSNRVLNLPKPTSNSEAARLADVQAGISGNQANLIEYNNSNVQEALDKRTIYVGSVVELGGLPSPTSGQQAIVNGCPFKYTGTEWIPSLGYVTGKAFGAAGDGVTDDTAAIQSALDYTKSEIYDFGDSAYLITDALVISRSNVEIKNGYFVYDKSFTLSDFGAFATTSIFTTTPITVGESLDNISFNGVRARSVRSAGKAGNLAFMFQSKSSLSSQYVFGRCDYLSVKWCQVEDIKLCGSYGKGVNVSNNQAMNSYSWDQENSRHACVLINQLITNDADVSQYDRLPSDVIVSDNRILNFGGGINVHHHFNNASPDRRVMSATVTGNYVSSWTVAEVAANPDLERGQYSVYFASVKDVICKGNTMQNGLDMVVDFEYCSKVIMSDNIVRNGGAKFFWPGAEKHLISGNIFEVTEPDYPSLFLFTGGAGVKDDFFITQNTFYNDLSASVSATVSINSGCERLVFSNNKLRDVIFYKTDNGVNLRSYIKNNEATFGAAISGNAFDIANSGRSYIKNNSIHSTVSQPLGIMGIRVNNVRIVVEGATVDPKEVQCDKNSIKGFSTSIQLDVSGSAFAFWLMTVIENEYDGSLVNGITRTDNRIFLKDNYRIGSDNRVYAADPATPPADGNYAKGSRIKLYNELDGTSGEINAYICTAEGAGTGGTWKSEVASY